MGIEIKEIYHTSRYMDGDPIYFSPESAITAWIYNNPEITNIRGEDLFIKENYLGGTIDMYCQVYRKWGVFVDE